MAADDHVSGRGALGLDSFRASMPAGSPATKRSVVNPGVRLPEAARLRRPVGLAVVLRSAGLPGDDQGAVSVALLGIRDTICMAA